MPVYNERETVSQAIEEVLDVELPGISIELIIVESNSPDGSREIVEKYADHERVTLLFEDEPKGKGHAVRAGLHEISGDIVLIQDADLEYDVADYAVLLQPILSGQADFVLGSRHMPGQPIRVMHESPVLSRIINGAHWVLLSLFNVTYGVRLRDPFTMYKVFRVECIDHVELVADRFDFDWELVGKLIRLGYPPLEVGVTYSARSFTDGKKVRFFRDPPTWIAACLRFRFSRLRVADSAGAVEAPKARNLAVTSGEPMTSEVLELESEPWGV